MFTGAGKWEEGLAIAPFLMEVGQHLVAATAPALSHNPNMHD